VKNFVEIRTIANEKVYSVRKTGPYQNSACEAYAELGSFIEKYKLDIPANNPKVKMYGVGYDNPYITPEAECRYDACITLTKVVSTEGNVNIQTIEGGKYAVFLHKGSYKELGTLYQAICGEWLSSNDYKSRDLPMFEVYLNSPVNTKEEDLLTEIYLPIQ